MGNRHKAPHHRGQHDRVARQVTANANANPEYRCPSCKLTLAEGVARWGTNGRWEAGHRIHGRSDLGYHAQHKHCNRSEGAAYGNKQRGHEPRCEW